MINGLALFLDEIGYLIVLKSIILLLLGTCDKYPSTISVIQ